MSSKGCIFVVAVVLLQLTQPIFSAKILGYLLTPGRSHFIIHDSLMRGLAAKGHNVTVLSIFSEPKEFIPNYRFLQVEMNADDTKDIADLRKFMLQAANDKSQPFSWSSIKTMHRINVNFLKNPVLQRLKDEEQFDLVVFGWFVNDYQIGVAAHFQCPSVIISGGPTFSLTSSYVGNPLGVAYAESMLYRIGNFPMTFKQRVITHLLHGIEVIAVNLIDRFVFEPTYAEHFPADRYASYAETKKNVSLVLVSSHFSNGIPLAAFPSLIEIAGIQIKKAANPLPDDIQTFLDDAKDGAIFMSFGSNINSAQMASDKLDAVLKVFGKLKQRVLWKWEDDQLPGQPDNVMIGKWLPQDDVLGHPNVRLFISHCGKGSVNEARSHGVPILAMPMFGDQQGNANGIVDEGWAVQQVYADLTEESFAEKLKEVLTNPKYREVVNGAAALFKDRPAHPLDTAVFWVEYVLRHNGAKHMQSQAVHLNWFQLQSLDVIAFLLAVVYVSWKVFLIVVKFVWRKCTDKGGSGTAKKVPNSKKQK